MANQINTGNGPEPAEYSAGSLDIDDNQSVSFYSSQPSQYSVENLEVRNPGMVRPQTQPKPTTGTSFNFSKKKAMIVSIIITLVVILLSTLTMLFVARQGTDESSSKLPKQQDIALEDAEDSEIPTELQGAEKSLLVNGDIVTRGTLKVSNGGFITIISTEALNQNQEIVLPSGSGTICLTTNNCAYGSEAVVNELQQQLAASQAQISTLQGQIDELSQVSVPPAGVNTLNNQRGNVSIQGSLNRIIVSTSNGVVTLTTPQDLDANANVQFGNLALSPSGQIRANTLIQTSAGNGVSVNAGADMITFVAGGRTFQLPVSGGATQTICTTGATCASGSGVAVLLGEAVEQTDATANASIFINDTGGGHLIHMRSGSVDRFTVANNGNVTVGGSLTVATLGNGFVRSTAGSLSVVSAIDLAADVTGTLPLANGGTGSTTAGGARTNLGAAASGSNADITSTTNLNTITPSAGLTVGAASQTLALQGAGNSSFAAGIGANVTTVNFAAPSGVNTITFPALSGTVCLSSGNCTAGGAAGGDLTGSYPNPTIASLQGSTLNIVGATGGQVLLYDGSDNRWENTTISGDITFTSSGVATIANNAITTGKISDGAVTNAKLQNSSLTVTAGSGLINGGAVSLGSAISLNIGQGDGITVSADDIAVDATVCRTSGNCAGVGGTGDITGTGNNNRIAMFNGSKTITSSTLLQSAGNLTLDSGNSFVITSGGLVLSSGNIDVTGGGNFTGTVSGADATQNDEFVTLQQLNTAVGGIDTGVDSVNGLGGDVIVQGTAGQITVVDNGTETITLSLNSAVTLQGNTFNGANQLVRLNGTGQLPVLDGSNLTDLNASNLASGTVNTARISGSYTGITGLGTVTTGVWNGTAIDDGYLQDNITVSSAGTVDWTALNNYPSACPAGQAITQLGDTITCQSFAAGSGSGSYIQNTTANQNSANLNIQSAAVGDVTAKFRVLGGQTADVIQVRDSGDSTTLFSVSASGAVVAASFTGNGSGLTNLNASNISSGTLNIARIADSSVTNAKLQNSSLTVTAGSGLINGGAVSLGSAISLNIGQGDGITVSADDIAVDATVCRTSGNCAGVGGTGDISGTGTVNRLAIFSGTKVIADSYLIQSAGTLTLDNGVDLVLAGGDINVTGAGTFTGTVSGANATQNDEFVTLQQLNAAIGGVGGGVSSLNTLAGDLDLQGTAGEIVVNDNGSDTITLSVGANVTLQGNTFNGADELVQLNGTGQLPVLDGSNLTNVNAALLQGQNGAYYLDLANATGTLNIARIADGTLTNVKLQNSSLTVSAGSGLTGGGSVALGAATTLNIGAGDGITVNANDVAVDATVARLNANANFTASLQQGGDDVCTTAGNCAGVGGTGDISGTGTVNRLAIFSGTKTIANSYLLQSAGTLTLDSSTNFVLTAGNLTLSNGDISVTGDGNFSGSLTAGTFVGNGAALTNLDADALATGTVASARISGSYTGITGVGTISVGTWNGTAITDAYVQDNITISSAGTVDWAALNNYPAGCAAGEAITALGDTVTCSAFATGGDGGVTTVGAIDSQTKSANGAVISGASLYLQTADASNPGLVSTGAQTFAGNKTFNGSVALAAGQSLTITGGNTGSRPGGATEGTVYYDTDTKQLLTYANGKWQADRGDAIYVAASNSSQTDRDRADFVADGNTGAALDGDQVQINAALIAGAGKKVVLLAGTYIVDASISVPNNTTLTGVGNGTVVELADLDVDINMITNTDTSTGTGVTIEKMKLDGRTDLNTAGDQYGVNLNGMGDFLTGRMGGVVQQLSVTRFGNGITASTSANTSFRDNYVSQSCIGIGISGLSGLVKDNVVTNSGAIAGCTGFSIIAEGNGMVVSDNQITLSGGASHNNAILVTGTDNATRVTSNTISDAAPSISNYAIVLDGTTEGVYVAGNIIDGAEINDLGTDTIYGGQIDTLNDYVIQGPAGNNIELMNNTNVTGTLNVTGNFDTNGSLTVGNANQFVINNTGVVTNGTWQAGTIGLLYGGTNNTSYTTNGIVYSNGTSLVSTGAGTTGQCLLATTGSAPTWASCTATTLQGAYDASSPATILMTNNKDFTINTGDTATDSSIIFNLSCATCSVNGGRFAVQDAGVDVFTVLPNGDIRLGTATNNMTLGASTGYKPLLSGTARNVKTIRLGAEYPGAVLAADLTNNLGTMTSDYDQTNRMNYYQWTTTQASPQDYDVVVQVPLPSDFDGWASNPLAITSSISTTTNTALTLEARDSTGVVICNFVDIRPAATSPTWATNNTACTLGSGIYTPGDYITLRIRMQAPNTHNVKLGNIILNYNSKF